MAKGYWIARIDVHNMDGYKEYVAQNGAVFAKYGARFLVRGGKHVPKEGSSRSRNVVLEFKDYETALACYNSPEYVRLVALRSPYAESDLVIIEGYDGPQPQPVGTQPAAGALKGYWIAHVDVTDPEGYKAYQAENGKAFSKYGARFLVRGGRCEVTEGHQRSRNVVMEFPSYDAALACYRSPEYQAAKALRLGKGEIDLVVIEGYDGRN